MKVYVSNICTDWDRVYYHNWVIELYFKVAYRLRGQFEDVKGASSPLVF